MMREISSFGSPLLSKDRLLISTRRCSRNLEELDPACLDSKTTPDPRKQEEIAATGHPKLRDKQTQVLGVREGKIKKGFRGETYLLNLDNHQVGQDSSMAKPLEITSPTSSSKGPEEEEPKLDNYPEDKDKSLADP